MIRDNLDTIRKQLPPEVQLVAVSKFHPLEAIREAYAAGQRVFAESRPQELAAKAAELAAAGDCPEIEWHVIGHLQTNKLKLVLPYVSLVQSVDSLHLLKAVNDWGRAAGKRIPVLLELHIAAEESKQGFFEEDALEVLFRAEEYGNVVFRGLMGMATLSEDRDVVAADFGRIRAFFDYLRSLFPEYGDFDQLSIGMSDDFPVALQHGSTMVRIGTAIFGPREY